MKKILLFNLLMVFGVINLMGSQADRSKDSVLKELQDFHREFSLSHNAKPQSSAALAAKPVDPILSVWESQLKQAEPKERLLAGSKIAALNNELAYLRYVDAQEIITPREKRLKMLDTREKKELADKMYDASKRREHQLAKTAKVAAQAKGAQLSVAGTQRPLKRKKADAGDASIAAAAGNSVAAKQEKDASSEKLTCGCAGCHVTFKNRETRRAHWINIHGIDRTKVTVRTEFNSLDDATKQAATEYKAKRVTMRRKVKPESIAKQVAVGALALGAATALITNATKPPVAPTPGARFEPVSQNHIPVTITQTVTTSHQQVFYAAPLQYAAPALPAGILNPTPAAVPLNPPITDQQTMGLACAALLLKQGYNLGQTAAILQAFNL